MSSKVDYEMKGTRMLRRIVMIAVGIGLLVTSPYALAFWIIGMLPAIVSASIDKRGHKHASNTVGVFNFIGILPFLLDLWKAPNPGDLAQNMIVDMTIWLFIYASAAFGWFMVWGMPKLCMTIFVARAESRINRLTAMQKELIEEWGTDITKL